jgi:hypothetical protein
MARKLASDIDGAVVQFLAPLLESGFTRKRAYWAYSNDGLVSVCASFKRADSDLHGPGVEGRWQFRGPSLAAGLGNEPSLTTFMPKAVDRFDGSNEISFRDRQDCVVGLTIVIGGLLHYETYHARAASGLLPALSAEFCPAFSRFAHEFASIDGFLAIARDRDLAKDRCGTSRVVSNAEVLADRVEAFRADTVNGPPLDEFRVLESDDPHWIAVEQTQRGDADSGASYYVSFSDLAAHEHETLVAQTVELIAAAPAVTDVAYEDRGLILVWGDAVDASRLEATIRDWWRIQLTSAD